MAPCGKKTTSGRMLGCVIFFPRLAPLVIRGVRGGAKPPLLCADCVTRGWKASLYKGFEQGG